MELASTRTALVALGDIAASLAGALAAAVLLSTIALAAHQDLDLHPAAGAKEKPGRSVRGRTGHSELATKKRALTAGALRFHTAIHIWSRGTSSAHSWLASSCRRRATTAFALKPEGGNLSEWHAYQT